MGLGHGRSRIHLASSPVLLHGLISGAVRHWKGCIGLMLSKACMPVLVACVCRCARELTRVSLEHVRKLRYRCIQKVQVHRECRCSSRRDVNTYAIMIMHCLKGETLPASLPNPDISWLNHLSWVTCPESPSPSHLSWVTAPGELQEDLVAGRLRTLPEKSAYQPDSYRNTCRAIGIPAELYEYLVAERLGTPTGQPACKPAN